MEEENFPQYTTLALIRDIWHYVRPHKWQFIIGSFFRFSSDALYLYSAYALSSIITFLTSYTLGSSLRSFWIIMLIWSLTSLYRVIGQNIGKYLGYQVAEKASLDAQKQTMQHMFALDISWHERENAGNKFKRFQRGGEGLNRILRIWINNFIEIAVNFTGMVIVILFFDLRMALFMVLFLTSYLIISYPLAKRSSRSAQAVNKIEEDYSGLSFEALANIRTVKVMALVSVLISMIADKSKELLARIKHRTAAFQLRNTVRGAWGHLWRTGLIAYIALGVVHGQYTVGFLVLFYMYFNKMWESVAELSEVTQDFVIAKYHIARMLDTLHTPLPNTSSSAIQFPINWKTISLKNVSFAYGDNEVLKNISFDIRRGEKLGVVGLSGAGKSTLFKLLLKEHDEFTGEISIDSVPIQDIARESFFKYTAVVLQDTEVFNFSLQENIAIANNEERNNSQLLQQSLNIAHVQDFLFKLPQGLNTLIGEKGVKLSGGEKQRLGIARAIFKQPQLLFLDEATSHLDLESEEKIRDSLHQFFQSVTAVVIAHRLTTIREMDRILVLENGQIVESGSFDELYQKHGRFFDLWEKQKL